MRGRKRGRTKGEREKRKGEGREKTQIIKYPVINKLTY